MRRLLRGWVDAVISRFMDVFLAFPLLLFSIALVGVIPDHAFRPAGDDRVLALLIFISGFFKLAVHWSISRGRLCRCASGVRRQAASPWVPG